MAYKLSKILSSIVLLGSLLMVLLTIFAVFTPVHAQNVTTIEKQMALSEMIVGKFKCDIKVIPDDVLRFLNESIAKDLGITPEESAQIIIMSADSIWTYAKENKREKELCKNIEKKSLDAFTQGV